MISPLSTPGLELGTPSGTDELVLWDGYYWKFVGEEDMSIKHAYMIPPFSRISLFNLPPMLGTRNTVIDLF